MNYISVHDITLAHARLSASGAHMWMNCGASAWAGDQFEDQGSEYADEGTRAHAICSDCLDQGIDTDEWCQAKFGCAPDELDEHDPDIADLYPIEMFEHAQAYVEFVHSEIEEAKLRNPDAIVYVERRVDFSPWVPEGFGTADCIIISDGVIKIIDFKFGKGVFVTVEENEQLMLYGLGAWNMFHHLFDITSLSLTVYQPRIGNIRTWDISVEQLLNWADAVVRPVAKRVWFALTEGDLTDVEFNPKDEDVCRFCKAKVHCRVRTEEALKMAQYTKEAALLTDAEVAAILPKVAPLKKWAGDLETWARTQAEKGARIAGWKLVEGRSNRKYADESAVRNTLLLEGFAEKDIYKPVKLLGVTAMTKLLKGAKKLDALLGAYITKPKGKPVLVPADDPRPELNDAASTAAEFGSAE